MIIEFIGGPKDGEILHTTRNLVSYSFKGVDMEEYYDYLKAEKLDYGGYAFRVEE